MRTEIKGYDNNPYNKDMIAVDKITGKIYNKNEFKILRINNLFYGINNILYPSIISTEDQILELQELRKG